MDISAKALAKELYDLGIDERGTFGSRNKGQSSSEPITQTNSKLSCSEEDLDNCYSDGENSHDSYKAGDYDKEDDFIDPDICSMANSSDSTYRDSESTQKTSQNPTPSPDRTHESHEMSKKCTRSDEVQKTTNNINEATTLSRKRKIDESSTCETRGKKLLTATDIMINRRYNCDVCDFSSSSPRDLHNHYLSDRHLCLIDINMDSIKFKCDFCHLRTKKRHDFVRHVRSKKHMKKVEMCGKV